MNAEVACKTVQEPLVAGPTQLFPRRYGEPIVTRQRLIVARNQRDSVVVGGKEHPPIKIIFGRQVQEKVNLSLFFLGWPGNVAANISGGCCHKMSTLLDHPNRNSATTQAAVDQRIRTLQSQLGITEAQMPLWSAFAQAMRENAAATDALFNQRASAVSTMNAPDNMHSYAQIARAYADNTDRLATAFDSLYASLSDTQKQAADTLFRQQATAAAQPKARR